MNGHIEKRGQKFRRESKVELSCRYGLSRALSAVFVKKVNFYYLIYDVCFQLRMWHEFCTWHAVFDFNQ